MTTAKSDDKDERAALLDKFELQVRHAASIWCEPWGNSVVREKREQRYEQAQKAVAELRAALLAAPLPELQQRVGADPFYAQWGDSGEGGMVVHEDDYRELERELYDAQNDLGRFQESNRVAQETIDDLRQQLNEARQEREFTQKELEYWQKKASLSTSGVSSKAHVQRLLDAAATVYIAPEATEQEWEELRLAAEDVKLDLDDVPVALSARPLNNDTDTTGAGK